MIDIFSLALSHGLLLLVAWRLMSRPDLDDDGADGGPRKTDLIGRPIKKSGAAGDPEPVSNA
ncbi:hypothetical protein [Parasphingopyxis lamellibrachiae]|uniref:Uncharacterized protein n=1 Tax=Parasphingopyxis lamellibrachiae TaxID=680125 RepID=A0A3D9FEB2_9SPHN|nr:hypothetical protein [Parasphingopyxis lamellibrachiae]RED16129.1 hypothetical protein DFR46_1143 [Parasphingopyxis lamellibrachiae]